MTLEDIISFYNNTIKNIENEAIVAENYGGCLRSNKGALVENIARLLIQLICEELGFNDIVIDSKKEKIAYNEDSFYNFSIDIQVKYNNILLLPIECKTYCDISMFKRVLYDANIARDFQNVKKSFLLQLEDSMNNKGVGSNIIYSKSTQFLYDYERNNICQILTLLDGQRNSHRPINKIEYFKELSYNTIYDVKETLKKALKEAYDRVISR